MQPRGLVLRFCIRPIYGAWAPGHDGYPRALDLNSRPGPEGHTGHLLASTPAGPFSPSPLSTRGPRREAFDRTLCVWARGGLKAGLCEAVLPEPSSLACPWDEGERRGWRSSPW